jgi:competence protein ComFC
MDNVAVLAQITAARAGVGVVDALQRTGADAQRGRSREARLAAVGRFVGDNARVRGQTVVLFDDVCTTGSTLEDCARAIRVAGGRVEKAVVAALA